MGMLKNRFETTRYSTPAAVLINPKKPFIPDVVLDLLPQRHICCAVAIS
jgi:hypothetical protein